MKSTILFTLIVHGEPDAASHLSAQNFIESAVELGHSIHSVFFYGDATSLCAQLTDDSQTKINTQKTWLKLSKQFNFPLQGCITTAIRRGVVDSLQAQQNGIHSNLLDGFELDGLGVLAESIFNNHRIIEFGA